MKDTFEIFNQGIAKNNDLWIFSNEFPYDNDRLVKSLNHFMAGDMSVLYAKFSSDNWLGIMKLTEYMIGLGFPHPFSTTHANNEICFMWVR